MSLREKCQLGAVLALSVAKKPAEVPKPVPNDPTVCPDCGGLGQLGDGTVKRKCKTCDGTGRRMLYFGYREQEAPKITPLKIGPLKPPSDGRLYRKVYRNDGGYVWELAK